ncbi:GIY-YIG nuclease family protein [Brevibacillus laterosporus]|uniref:GIY-YIG nuclease family protein n=1 Tax=Brevibacillus laterosporus TaxID=1465 RepID=UPI000CE33A3F|nr:GIY-YIG nuclease family protein [Brevibacillus laterosporus]AYB40556.1 GIY-YIG nuclease family protein [Brevibacillus laterosporus]MBM7111653.1 hypothetical protein [Brevibacillus laterosporus]PPA83242.1 DUF4357 domain-containing protein [Brevibacillus laterosporus]
MVKGSSIRIYLSDGTVTGIRHAEVVNWTGQAIACPRTKISDLSTWFESTRPGVYFLFGYDDEKGKNQAYIGEAENVFERIKNHMGGKEFWHEVVLFTNKDENLTKAHVRFLESKLIELALDANRYEILNTNQPQPTLLPRGDRDAMVGFIDHLKVLLGVLGHKVLETITKNNDISINGSSSSSELVLNSRDLEARALLTDEGVVVLKESRVAVNTRNSLPNGYFELRKQLIEKGFIVQDGENLIFAHDYLFSSPTSAAAIIVGYAINGREAWKTSDGISLGQFEQLLTI